MRTADLVTALMKQAATGAQLGGTDAGSERGKPAMVMTRDAQHALVKRVLRTSALSPLNDRNRAPRGVGPRLLADNVILRSEATPEER